MRPLAELRLHHSHAGSPTRRVVAEPLRLRAVAPESVVAAQLLVAALVVWEAPLLDDEQRDRLPAVLALLEERPRPARMLGYRAGGVPTGLDLSVHAVFEDGGAWHVRLDDQGPPAAQVVGAFAALAGLTEGDRLRALGLVESALDVRSGEQEDLLDFIGAQLALDCELRTLPASAKVRPAPAAARPVGDRAWALQLLGLGADASSEEVRRAYRRAVSEAHPDHGAAVEAAAARIEALARARRILTGGTGGARRLRDQPERPDHRPTDRPVHVTPDTIPEP